MGIWSSSTKSLFVDSRRAQRRVMNEEFSGRCTGLLVADKVRSDIKHEKNFYANVIENH